VRCQAQAASHPHGSAACQPSVTGRDAARPSPSSPAHRSRSPSLSMAPAPQSHLARICGRRQAGHPRRAAAPRTPSPSSWPLLPIPCLLHDTSTVIPSFFGAPSHDDEASSAAGHHSAPLHPHRLPAQIHGRSAGRWRRAARLSPSSAACAPILSTVDAAASGPLSTPDLLLVVWDQCCCGLRAARVCD
jgi:hypothetical protein